MRTKREAFYEALGEADVDNPLNKAENILFRLRHGQNPLDFIHIRQALDSYLEELAPEAEPKPGQPARQFLTGFAQLDDFMGGLHRSDLIILLARPNMGKTSLALNIALNAARKKSHARGDVQSATIALFSGRQRINSVRRGDYQASRETSSARRQFNWNSYHSGLPRATRFSLARARCEKREPALSSSCLAFSISASWISRCLCQHFGQTPLTMRSMGSPHVGHAGPADASHGSLTVFSTQDFLSLVRGIFRTTK